MIDLEKTIIGEMFSDEGIMVEAISELSVDDFSDFLCKRIFEACVVTFTKGYKVDPLSVQREWEPEFINELKNALLACYQSVVSTSAYKQHFKQLKESTVIRRARAKTSDMFDAFAITADVEELREMAADILRAFDTEAQTKCVDAKTGYQKFINRIGKKRNYIKTGIRELDYYLKIEKGDFVVLGGRPSSGKTAITLQIAANMAKKNKILYFSFETSDDKLFDRVVSTQTLIDFGKIKRGELDENDKCFLDDEFKEYFEGLDLVMVNAAGMSVAQMQSIAIQHKADVMFVDYMGLVNSGKDNLSPYEKASQISVALHTLAQSQKITVFALCQLNRMGKNEPDMTSLRDSGQIEQDADAIILLSTPDEEKKNIKKLAIAKNKEGECREAEICFKGEYQRFYSLVEE